MPVVSPSLSSRVANPSRLSQGFVVLGSLVGVVGLTCVRAIAASEDPPQPAAVPWDVIEPLARDYIDAGIAPSIVIGTFVDGKADFRGFMQPAAALGTALPPGPDTLYEIGSVTKTFTSLLFAIAVAQGEFTPDSTLTSAVPAGVVVPDDGDDETPILLKHLATHTSGLPRMPGNFMPRNPLDPFADYDTKRLYEGLAATTVNDTPGKRYVYSNFAMGLLGQVLAEKAGRHDYSEILAERLLAPMGLSSTRLSIDAATRAKLPEGTIAPPFDADLAPNSEWNFTALAGCGAIRSSARDMIRYLSFQLSPPDGPLGDAIRRTQQVFWEDKKIGLRLGLGWHISPADVHWHNGQTGGYHSFVAFSTSKKVGVVVLANAATGEIDKLGDYAIALLIGAKPPVPTFFRPVPLAADAMRPFVGKYQLGPLARFTIELEEQGKTRPPGLYAQLTGQPSVRVYPESESRFRYRVVEAALSFETKDGKTTALVLHQNGANQRAERISE